MHSSEGFLLFILLEKKHWVCLGKLKKWIQERRKYDVKGKETTHGEDYAVDLESNLFKLKQDVKEGQDSP